MFLTPSADIQYDYCYFPEHLNSHIDVLQHGSVTFDFWVSKLKMWPELSRYALEVIACPAAVVLSEKVLSTSLGVITDKHICLPTDKVDF